MLEYIERKRSIYDSLAENLHPISDEDLVGYILSGLDSSYCPFSTAFMMKSDDVTVDDLVGLLLQEEARLEQEHAHQAVIVAQPSNSASLLPTPAVYTTNRSSNRSNSTNYPTNNVAPFSHLNMDNRRRRPICQLCNKPGHVAIDCWQHTNQTDYPSRRQNPRHFSRQAHLTHSGTSSTIMDPSWYFDTGATDYVTPDINKLNIADDYNGDDKLQVGNDNHLSISHVGSTSFYNISLPSVLIVPDLLAQSSLPPIFWEHAFKIATYLHNRTITPLLQFQSPYH
ncbi:unnamed protein product [Lupinus luteus]|uniref:CCHC-type domain-containing protein n=1 Tax=Lupinus luteus TaxID=3873 RepID=A0AAV1YHU8_LUPLU